MQDGRLTVCSLRELSEQLPSLQSRSKNVASALRRAAKLLANRGPGELIQSHSLPTAFIRLKAKAGPGKPI